MPPFVAIVLGPGSQRDAEQLARTAGATALLRAGQSHPMPLPAVETVIDLADPEAGTIDLVPPSPYHVDELIELAPGQPRSPETAVVIDPAEVRDVADLARAVEAVLDGLAQLEAETPGGCVVASRMVTDTLKLVDEAGLLLGTAERNDHRWVSAPLAGPLLLLSAVAELPPAPAADEQGSPSVRPLVEALVRRGVEVRAVPI